MKNVSLALVAMMLVPCLFAVDGVVLINQSTVLAAGGFPYKITHSGSYKLTGNLTVPDANTTAISITASDVTLDLNGFGIIGPTVCAGANFSPVTSCAPIGTGFGVFCDIYFGNITVMNGFVRGMGNVGVEIFNGSIQNVRAISNGLGGLVANTGVLSGNVSEFNGNSGIEASYATVSGNTVTSNQTEGISVFCPSTVVGNTAVFNTLNLRFIVGVGSAACVAANNTAP